MSWWLRKCFFLFCIMEDDLWDIMLQHVAALPNFFCQTSHLWISLTALSELSVFHQKFSINNEALQVWRWHPSVKLHVCWQLAGIDSGRCDGCYTSAECFPESAFWAAEELPVTAELYGRQFHLKENETFQKLEWRTNATSAKQADSLS